MIGELLELSRKNEALEAEIERLKKIITKELTENDDLGSEFVYVQALKGENARLTQQNEIMREALEDLLSNVALDWYVQQFAQKEVVDSLSSGLVQRIHNEELVYRAKMAFEKARKALAIV